MSETYLPDEHVEAVAYADDVAEGTEVPDDYESHYCDIDGEEWPCKTAVWLAEHDAKVRAEALWKAAAWVEDVAAHDGLMYREFDNGEEVAESIPDALRVRADRIEQGKEEQ